VVHRDIKPENILLHGGHALVADFGIARAITAAGGERLTETGLAIGTAAYMSPEQAAADARVDGRSDIYSLGCVLYEMMAGEPPFTGPSAQAVIARKLTDPVRPLRTIRESVPPQLEHLILKAMSRAPVDRFPSAARLTEALEQLLAEAPMLASSGRGHGTFWSRAVSNRSVWISLAAIAVLAGLGTLLWARESRVRWARNVALPEARRLEAVGRPYAAFRLLRQAETYLPDDPALQDLLDQWSDSVSVRTTPPGAQVLVRDFLDAPTVADTLGSTPLEQIRLPSGPLVWHISHPGYRNLEVLGVSRGRDLDFSLTTQADAPLDMVHVTGGPLPERIFELYSVRPVELADYWFDQHEVTNRQFKKFVDEGGYQADRYWPHFAGEGTTLTSEQAKQTFRDRTGRPGPATWEAGTYGEDQEDFPVSGISWYEAAAYCAFVGKQLPTVYHWYNAGKFGFTGGFARFGNFQADGPAKVGHFRRLGGSGTYDMAGNVKEWVWNQANSDRRYILGGAWNEPSYQFRDYDAQPPLDRQPTYGVRCARYQTADSATLMSRVAAPSRDYRDETPAGDEVFSVYRSLYQYDRRPLEARVDSSGSFSEHWRTQWVSFAAAYGNDRVPAILVLPNDTRPPYQLVIYFPGANAFSPEQPAAAAIENEGDWFLYLVRTGRAVLLPVYQGAYERYVPGIFELPHVWRDVTIHAAKDLRRAVDYAETMPEIDAEKVAFLGLSMGAAIGPIMTAIEPRFKASILIGGGLYHWRRPPESETINFLPRVKAPTLMINGRYDFFFSLKTSQGLMFDLLGTPAEDKKHHLFDSGHIPSERQEVIKEILDWLDRYLGPVER
jgi:formylglycine-generating enzyme required for sulfatase activity/dienelactone hydrolase